VKLQLNAILFKDLTQGIRNKTFVGTFFGLLGLSALISFLVISGSQASGTSGIQIFLILCGLLYFYVIFLGARCRSLIAKEVNSGTLELFMLSGMSPEKTALGRILTVMYQLFFGFCCVIPFMFSAYFLGGIDFLVIILTALFMFLMALPYFLLVIVLGSMVRYKKIRTLAVLAYAFLTFIMIAYGGTMIFGLSQAGSLTILSMGGAFKGMFFSGGRGFLWLGMGWIGYLEIALLLFFCCCHMLCYETDSRESRIKGMLFIIFVTALILPLVFSGSLIPVGFPLEMTTFWIFNIFLVIQLFFFVNRIHPPRVVEYKASRYGLLRRVIHWFLRPGLVGTARLLILMIGLSIAFFIIYDSTGNYLTYGSRKLEPPARFIGLVVQSFYFVCLLDLMLRWISGKLTYANRRALIVAIWIGGLVVSIFLLVSGGLYNFEDLGLLNQLISPALAVGTGLMPEYDDFLWLRIITGFAGFISMIVIADTESKKSAAR